MKKYTVEFLGTMLFVFSIMCIVSSGSTLAPIAIGITLAAMIYMGGAISGAHYNPAVTFGLLINKKISGKDAGYYVLSQLLGALVAYAVFVWGMNLSLTPVALLGDLKSFFIAEFIFTFALVTTIYFTAVNKATAGNSYFGLAIASVVVAGAVAVGGISGGFFNPAVLLGIGLFGIPGEVFVIILLAQLAGGAAAAGLYRYVVGK